jgi:hypothetical protein
VCRASHATAAESLDLGGYQLRGLTHQQRGRFAAVADHPAALKNLGEQQAGRRDRDEDGDERSIEGGLCRHQDQRDRRDTPGLRHDHPARHVEARAGQEAQLVNPQTFGREDPGGNEHQQQVGVLPLGDGRLQTRQGHDQSGVRDPGQEHRRDDDQEVFEEDGLFERAIAGHDAFANEAPAPERARSSPAASPIGALA